MRWTPIFAGATAVTTLLGGAGWFLGTRHGSVQLPSAQSSPTDVVRAYVRAVDVRGIATANAIQMVGPPDEDQGWYHSPSITNLTIEHTPPVSAGSTWPGTRMTGYRQVSEVDTTATFRHWDGMQDGRTAWSYYLVRNADTERWRIADWGQG